MDSIIILATAVAKQQGIQRRFQNKGNDYSCVEFPLGAAGNVQ